MVAVTHESDFVRLHTKVFGVLNIPLRKLGLEWPPPERLIMDLDDDRKFMVREPTEDDDPNTVFRRTNLSRITDEQMEGMEHVARGAEYKYEGENQ